MRRLLTRTSTSSPDSYIEYSWGFCISRGVKHIATSTRKGNIRFRITASYPSFGTGYYFWGHGRLNVVERTPLLLEQGSFKPHPTLCVKPPASQLRQSISEQSETIGRGEGAQEVKDLDKHEQHAQRRGRTVYVFASSRFHRSDSPGGASASRLWKRPWYRPISPSQPSSCQKRKAERGKEEP